MNPQVKIFSFDVKDINTIVRKARLMLPFRYDCNGYIVATNMNCEKTYIYVTNYPDFISDIDLFVKEATAWKKILFNVTINSGWLFNSYTYVKHSVCHCEHQHILM